MDSERTKVKMDTCHQWYKSINWYSSWTLFHPRLYSSFMWSYFLITVLIKYSLGGKVNTIIGIVLVIGMVYLIVASDGVEVYTYTD